MAIILNYIILFLVKYICRMIQENLKILQFIELMVFNLYYTFEIC